MHEDLQSSKQCLLMPKSLGIPAMISLPPICASPARPGNSTGRTQTLKGKKKQVKMHLRHRQVNTQQFSTPGWTKFSALQWPAVCFKPFLSALLHSCLLTALHRLYHHPPTFLFKKKVNPPPSLVDPLINRLCQRWCVEKVVSEATAEELFSSSGNWVIPCLAYRICIILTEPCRNSYH